MTEDQINPLCWRLFAAIRDEKEQDALALGLELLAGFLTDVNRIASFIQQSYEARGNADKLCPHWKEPSHD